MKKEETQELIRCENVLPTNTILIWRSYVEAKRAEVVPVEAKS